MATAKRDTKEDKVPEDVKEEPKQERTARSLHRSVTNKIIAGVAGGLGEYFDVDASIVRIIFVLLTIFHGSGLLIYIVLWIILPKEGDVRTSRDSLHDTVHTMKDEMRSFAHSFRGEGNGRLWIGGLLVVLGVLFLLQNAGLLLGIDIGKLWPVILIVVGLAMVF